MQENPPGSVIHCEHFLNCSFWMEPRTNYLRCRPRTTKRYWQPVKQKGCDIIYMKPPWSRTKKSSDRWVWMNRFHRLLDRTQLTPTYNCSNYTTWPSRHGDQKENENTILSLHAIGKSPEKWRRQPPICFSVCFFPKLYLQFPRPL